MTLRASRTIDLNADLGEHDGDGYAGDEALLGAVSSASIACGSHAGSKDVMERTARACLDRGVSIGAHPSYPDREGFGRRNIDIALEALIGSIEKQMLLMAECCARAGAVLRYVKLHGALYNRAARDAVLSAAIARSIARFDASLAILAPHGSELANAALSSGLVTIPEAFVDRAYMNDGSLVSRDRAGAVIDDPDFAANRALHLAAKGMVEALDGSMIRVNAKSLCVHSDSPGALEIIRAARSRLEQNGFTIRAFA